MLFSDGTPSEKYFAVGIRIFLWVFARIGVFEFSVVMSSAPYNRLTRKQVKMCPCFNFDISTPLSVAVVKQFS